MLFCLKKNSEKKTKTKNLKKPKKTPNIDQFQRDEIKKLLNKSLQRSEGDVVYRKT